MAFMPSASPAPLTPQQRAGLDAMAAELQRIFGARLRSFVAYGLAATAATDGLIRTLALLDQLVFDDLSRCVPHASAWHRAGLAVPLLLTQQEFFRSLDVFPLEYGDIMRSHVLVAGDDLFSGTTVAEADRRRGCEQQAKSHLIHLREGFLETEGHAREVSWLIVASVPAFRTLLANIARLENAGVETLSNAELGAIAERVMGVPASLVAEILAAPAAASTIVDPTALLARYVDASERIWRYVDGWRS
jgi:hypothetical protein